MYPSGLLGLGWKVPWLVELPTQRIGLLDFEEGDRRKEQRLAMSHARVFADEELKAMESRTLDLLKETIESGDADKAKELAQRMYEEVNYLHDGYMFWVSGLLTHIYKNYGIDAVERAEREAHTIEGKVVFRPLEKTDFRSRVEHAAKAMRGHLQPLAIEEDDEKVTITMKPCGSGERIIAMGGYEAGLATVEDPHNITWGMKDFPIYCVHCPVMEMLTVENMGHFDATRLVSDPMRHGFCHFAFYKDPADIPEAFYTRIGKKKPVTPN
jgi:hypothetical protein